MSKKKARIKDKREDIAWAIQRDFDVTIPMLSWSGMTEKELIDIYNELATENGKPMYKAE